MPFISRQRMGASWLRAPRIDALHVPKLILEGRSTRLVLEVSGWGWLLLGYVDHNGRSHRKRLLLSSKFKRYVVEVALPAIVEVDARNIFGADHCRVRLDPNTPGPRSVTPPRAIPLPTPPRTESRAVRTHVGAQTEHIFPTKPFIRAPKVRLPEAPIAIRFMELDV
jgi:hypothetical protein